MNDVGISYLTSAVSQESSVPVTAHESSDGDTCRSPWIGQSIPSTRAMTGSPALGAHTCQGLSAPCGALSSEATITRLPWRAATSGRSLMRSFSATIPPLKPSTIAKGPFSMPGP